VRSHAVLEPHLHLIEASPRILPALPERIPIAVRR
jgi:NADH dehydrogenase FAD-containing subunit